MRERAAAESQPGTRRSGNSPGATIAWVIHGVRSLLDYKRLRFYIVIEHNHPGGADKCPLLFVGNPSASWVSSRER